MEANETKPKESPAITGEDGTAGNRVRRVEAKCTSAAT